MNYRGQEVFFDRNDLIVSKTDLKGILTYANHTFLEIAGYREDEVIGKPHNMIRHENMPRGVFEYFWQTLKQEQEIFAYVVNKTKSGDHYWVLAHVTPSYRDGHHVGYHSTRRVPDPRVIKTVIEPLYDEMNAIEAATSGHKEGTAKSLAHLTELMNKKQTTYSEFMSSLMLGKSLIDGEGRHEHAA
ncbi:PAS domain-containing protein [Sneathiella limimaris]|uniref:PAS domain-containing protein n=1 Tax=Sneathiella limimaris TaxID=1964213 RepID=UPI00146B8198|nr:PAS domain S-box protein [Sneathiella limimaris]